MSDTSSQTIAPLYDNDVTKLVNTQVSTADATDTWVDTEARLQVVYSDHAVALDFSYYGSADASKESSRDQTVKDINREVAAVDRFLREVQAFRNRFVEQAKADLDRLKQQ